MASGLYLAVLQQEAVIPLVLYVRDANIFYFKILFNGKNIIVKLSTLHTVVVPLIYKNSITKVVRNANRYI